MGKNDKVSVGQSAPEFSGETDGGGSLSKADLAGKRFVLYFYPKDDTPGCTTQACDFRDALDDFAAKGVTIVGVSPDSVKSHDKFKAKYDLPFTLVSDPDKKIAEAYGVYREKKNYGRTYLGIVRSTFVIGEDGNVEAVHDNVRAKGHVARLLDKVS